VNAEHPEERMFPQHHNQVIPIREWVDLPEELNALWFDDALNCTSDAALVL
jgi:hypothetical protein